MRHLTKTTYRIAVRACASHLALVSMVLLLPFFSVSAADTVRATNNADPAAAARKNQILHAEAAEAMPAACEKQGKKAASCSLNLLSHTLARLYVSSSSEDTRALDRQLVAGIAEYTRIASDSQLSAESRPGKIDDERDSNDFYLNYAGTLYRLQRLFGAGGQRAEWLGKDTQASVMDAFWAWASGHCALADTRVAHAWQIVGSENHTALFDSSCWAAADLLSQTEAYRSRPYRDGSSAVAQLAAWTQFEKTYVRERARHGLFLEYFSPTYAKYTLFNLYLYADFSRDDELRLLARNALDLWWALWAVEQVDGMHGGSKARAYDDTLKDGDAMWDAAWLYFGFRNLRIPNATPPLVTLATSDYQPLPLISRLALDAAGRGSYEVSSRVRGRADPAGQGVRGVVQVAADDSSLLRYTYVTPQFSMGLAQVPRLPFKQWVAGSSQNRWAGLVFAGSQTARIVFKVAGKGQNNYNALWGVQSKGTQLVQALPAPWSANGGPLQVWFSGELKRVERDGWVFVDGAGYAALRPASGGYSWLSADGGQILVPDDGYAPVVLQASTRDRYPNFPSFQSAVLAAPLSRSKASTEFTGLDHAGRLRLYGDSGRLPEIDGRPITLGPGASIESPFLSGGGKDAVFKLSKDGNAQTLDFR